MVWFLAALAAVVVVCLWVGLLASSERGRRRRGTAFARRYLLYIAPEDAHTIDVTLTRARRAVAVFFLSAVPSWGYRRFRTQLWPSLEPHEIVSTSRAWPAR